MYVYIYKIGTAAHDSTGLLQIVAGSEGEGPEAACCWRGYPPAPVPPPTTPSPFRLSYLCAPLHHCGYDYIHVCTYILRPN
jgi:hypothetical protein